MKEGSVSLHKWSVSLKARSTRQSNTPSNANNSAKPSESAYPPLASHTFR